MFVFESYIKRPAINISFKEFEELNQKPEKYFIHIDDTAALAEIRDQIDPHYIEGVLYFCYKDEIIFNYELWDDVDTLWAYLLNMVADFLEKGEAEVYFPDQPIKLNMMPAENDQIEFSVRVREYSYYSFPKTQFFHALLDSAESFFRKLAIFMEDYEGYEYQWEKIVKLRGMIKQTY